MKTHFKMSVLIAAVFSAAVFAGSIDLSMIPSDAVWHSHFDVEKFNDSQLRVIAEERGMSEKFAKIEQFIGLNPAEDITGVTLFGTSFDPDDASAILKGNFNVKKLVKIAQKQPEYTSIKSEGYEISSWKSHKGVTKAGYFFDDSTLVMSRSVDSIISTINTLTGKKGSLSDTQTTTSEDAILQIFIQDTSNVAQADSHLVFLNNVGTSLFAMGQKGEDIFCEIIMQADTAENSELLKQMIEGMVAMGKMKASEKKNQLATEALNSVAVNTENETVITTMVLDTLQFGKIIDKLEENKEVLTKICNELPSNGCI